MCYYGNQNQNQNGKLNACLVKSSTSSEDYTFEEEDI